MKDINGLLEKCFERDDGLEKNSNNFKQKISLKFKSIDMDVDNLVSELQKTHKTKTKHLKHK